MSVSVGLPFRHEMVGLANSLMVISYDLIRNDCDKDSLNIDL